jgi:hypothetical protein
MTDHELDEMLDTWTAPPLRDSLRGELRAGFAGSPKRPSRFRRMIAAAREVRVGRLAVAASVAAALLFAILQVSPRIARLASPGFRPPFYVLSEFTRYADDGSVEYRSRRTAFPYGGIAVNMSVTDLGNPVLDVFRGIAASIRTQVVLAVPSLVLPKAPPMTEPAWFAGFVRSGCAEGKNVVGHEVVAGFETTIIEAGDRLRFWMAPDLACFCLKTTYEARAPNGSYRLQHRNETLKVTMNP